MYIPSAELIHRMLEAPASKKFTFFVRSHGSMPAPLNAIPYFVAYIVIAEEVLNA